jgi:hypothetical protein
VEDCGEGRIRILNSVSFRLLKFQIRTYVNILKYIGVGGDRDFVSSFFVLENGKQG